jgi:hypothetical protein
MRSSSVAESALVDDRMCPLRASVSRVLRRGRMLLR